MHHPGISCRGNATSCPLGCLKIESEIDRVVPGRVSPVIARSNATKQSIFCFGDHGLLRGACHPTALCADRVARNDDA
jgi:hypothetical protein